LKRGAAEGRLENSFTDSVMPLRAFHEKKQDGK